MKKFLMGLLAVVLVGGVGIYLFRAPLMDMLFERITADMFVESDIDPYDPGVALGERLPSLLALHQGAEVTDLASFMGENGLVLYAIRSVDW